MNSGKQPAAVPAEQVEQPTGLNPNVVPTDPSVIITDTHREFGRKHHLSFYELAATFPGQSAELSAVKRERDEYKRRLEDRLGGSVKEFELLLSTERLAQTELAAAKRERDASVSILQNELDIETANRSKAIAERDAAVAEAERLSLLAGGRGIANRNLEAEAAKLREECERLKKEIVILVKQIVAPGLASEATTAERSVIEMMQRGQVAMEAELAQLRDDYQQACHDRDRQRQEWKIQNDQLQAIQAELTTAKERIEQLERQRPWISDM